MGEYQANGEKLVGVEVTKTSVNAVCLDAAGKIIGTDIADIDQMEPSSKQVIEYVGGLRSIFGDFKKVGVALPGLVDRGGRRIAFSSHIPEHSGLDLASDIEAASGVKALIENDANAAAFGEFNLGAGRGSANMFYATLGLGVGGAFIFGGGIWRGAAGFAGEFGFVPINEEGTRLEDAASSANIIRRTRSRIHQDRTSSLYDLDESKMTIGDIVDAAEAGDDFARLMLERTGGYVGNAISCVINLLNIETIVIGGKIMESKTIMLDAIITAAREMSFGPSFGATSILAGELGDNAAAAGAALLTRQI